jgi:hypothetical protein
VIDSRRSTPSSKLCGPYSAEILRIPCGPNCAPRGVSPVSTPRGHLRASACRVDDTDANRYPDLENEKLTVEQGGASVETVVRAGSAVIKVDNGGDYRVEVGAEDIEGTSKAYAGSTRSV